jgi:hypothetical protein
MSIFPRFPTFPGLLLSTAATSAGEQGQVEEARGLRGGELAPRSSPTPSPKVFRLAERETLLNRLGPAVHQVNPIPMAEVWTSESLKA